MPFYNGKSNKYNWVLQVNKKFCYVHKLLYRSSQKKINNKNVNFINGVQLITHATTHSENIKKSSPK